MKYKIGDTIEINNVEWIIAEYRMSRGREYRYTLSYEDTDGTYTKIHMGEGELWYLDIRKPHTAINGGDKNRIHLVIDIRCNKDFRNWLVDSSKKYPQPKEVDDYDE